MEDISQPVTERMEGAALSAPLWRVVECLFRARWLTVSRSFGSLVHPCAPPRVVYCPLSR